MSDSNDLVVSKELTAKEEQSALEAIQEISETTQRTGTLVMSVVEFSVLVTFFEGNAESTFYIPALFFISTAIALQVIVGFLILYIGCIEKYYKSFGDYVSDDGGWCPDICRCTPRAKSDIDPDEVLEKLWDPKRDETELFGVVNSLEKKREIKFCCCGLIRYTYNPKSKVSPFGGGSIERTCGCFSCICRNPCRSSTYNKNLDLEGFVEKSYNTWKVLNTTCKLASKGLERGMYDNIAASLTGNEADRDLITENGKLKTKEITRSTEPKLKSMQEKGEKLLTYLDAAKKQRVQEKISSLQDAITILLYIILFFNLIATLLDFMANGT